MVGAVRQILAAGLAAADPFESTRRRLSELKQSGELAASGRLILVAAGKAAVPMAQAAHAALGQLLSSGLVVTHATPLALARARRSSGSPARPAPLPEHLEVRVASHPVPDSRGLRAAAELEALARELGPTDLMLLLLSGGASALLPSPAEPLSLQDEQQLTQLLLASGAAIAEQNAVRKHLSRLKGGGLARLVHPARVLTLAVSDVVGDDPAVIASGPVSADPSTFADAIRVLRSRRIWSRAPLTVRRHLEEGAAGRLEETLKPGSRKLSRVGYEVVAGVESSLRACSREARRLGLRPVVLSSRLEGEAREAGARLAYELRRCATDGDPALLPCCLLAGGETTVQLTGRGRGGRNHELALAAAVALEGFPGIAAAGSLATDGLDGTSRAAGAVVDHETLARARCLGLPSARATFARNDSGPWLRSLGASWRTGPTGCNLGDLVALAAVPTTSRRPRL